MNARIFQELKATTDRIVQSFLRMDFAQKMVTFGLLICTISLGWPLFSLAQWMIEIDYYQHFPLLVFAALSLAIMRFRKEEVRFLGIVSPRVALWFGISLLMTTVVFVMPSRWFAGPAILATLIAGVYFWGGPSFSKIIQGPMLLLFACIPLPAQFDNWFVVSLQQLATWLASLWLDFFGVMHYTTGVSIETPGQDYYVKDACSGIHSVFAAVAVGAGYGVIRGYRALRVLLMVLQLLVWVVLANAVRVFLTVYGQSKYDWNLTSSGYHEVIGVATFVLGVLLAISGDHFFCYLMPPQNENVQVNRSETYSKTNYEFRWVDRPIAQVFSASLIAAGLLMAVLVSFFYFRYIPSSGSARSMSIDQMADLAFIDIRKVNERLFPKELGKWKLDGFKVETRGDDSIFGGMVSCLWQYSNGTRSVIVSLDGPYDDWHDLAVCYRGAGWSIENITTLDQLVEDDSPEPSQIFASQLEIERKPLDTAHVIYVCVDPMGSVVKPPVYLGNAALSFVRRLELGMQDRPGFKGGVLQLQVFDQRPLPIPESHKKENVELLWSATSLLLKAGKS